MMSETKLDVTFAEGGFLVDEFSPPYRTDKNTNRSGTAPYKREDIPSRKILLTNDDKDVEHFYVEINLQK